jgi:hypothetical protein
MPRCVIWPFCSVTAQWIRGSVSLQNTAQSLSSIGLQYNPALTRYSQEALLYPSSASSVARHIPELSLVPRSLPLIRRPGWMGPTAPIYSGRRRLPLLKYLFALRSV